MARDGRFPAHKVMQRVNPRTHTPIPATLLVVITGIVLMLGLPGAALSQLIATSTLIGVGQYILTVVLYLAVRRKFDRGGGGFDLGRFDRLVAVAALAWVLICLFTVLVSFTTLATLLVFVGLLLA